MTRLSRTAVNDLLVLSLLSLLGIVGYETSFGDLNFLVAAIAGLVVGTLAAVAGTVWRLGAVTTVLLAMAGYVLVGTPVTMPDAALFVVLPSLAALTGLVIGPVYGWADIVTIGTPVEAPDYVAVVPYFAAWLVALVGTMLATRWLPRRRTALRSSVLLIGPVVLYLSGILLGTDEAYLAGVRGVAFAVIALVWLAWRRGATVEASGDGAARLRRQKVAGTATVVARRDGDRRRRGARPGAGLTRSLRAARRGRAAVRPAGVPEPAVGIPHLHEGPRRDPAVRGDRARAGRRHPARHDGRLHRTALERRGPDDVGPDGGGYGIVGETLPEPLLATLGSERRVEVQVDAYDDVWLPTVGYGEALRLVDPGTSDRAGDLRYNPSAGTAVLTSGVAEGARYELDARVQVEPETDELLDTPVANLAMPAVENAPDVVAAKADEYVGEATTPIEQLRAIETGAEDQRVPQPRARIRHRAVARGARRRPHHRAVHAHADGGRRGAVRLGDGADGPPPRLPRAGRHGLRPRGGRRRAARSRWSAVTSTAWVEVPFEGVGWVSFRPTPDQVDVPQEQTPKPKSEPQPQVRQPPRAEHDEEQLLTTVEIDDSDDDRDRPFVLPAWVWVTIAARRHPGGARVPADARRRGREGRTPSPSPQRRERPPGRGRLGGARRPLRRARVRAARRRARGCSPPGRSSGSSPSRASPRRDRRRHRRRRPRSRRPGRPCGCRPWRPPSTATCSRAAR